MIGVLHTAEGIQAVFQVGEEWDNAIRLILSFIKAKLLPTGQAQCLIPRWKERKQESEVKACADLRGVRTRSTRAQFTARELPAEGGTLTRGKTKHTTRRDIHTQHNPHT